MQLMFLVTHLDVFQSSQLTTTVIPLHPQEVVIVAAVNLQLNLSDNDQEKIKAKVELFIREEKIPHYNSQIIENIKIDSYKNHSFTKKLL